MNFLEEHNDTQLHTLIWAYQDCQEQPSHPFLVGASMLSSLLLLFLQFVVLHYPKRVQRIPPVVFGQGKQEQNIFRKIIFAVIQTLTKSTLVVSEVFVRCCLTICSNSNPLVTHVAQHSCCQLCLLAQ